MRSIGEIENEDNARLFGDYLYSVGIENEIEPAASGDGFAVWVLDDEKLEAGRAELEAFRANPRDAHFERGARKGRARWETDRKEAKKAAPVKDARTSFGAGEPTVPVISFGLVAFSILVFLFRTEAFSGPVPADGMDGVRAALQISATTEGFLPEVMRGEAWRIFTPIFIHFGIIHLLFNMMWVMQLGTMLERVHGRFFFIVLVVSIAFFSNSIQYLVSGPHFGGMSGVVFGIFGFAWVRGKIDVSVPYRLDQATVVLMVFWLFLCYTGVVGPIANWAHTVGLLTGAAVAFATGRPLKFA